MPQCVNGNSLSNGKSGSSIIVVEDLPNAFFREPLQFHEILR